MKHKSEECFSDLSMLIDISCIDGSKSFLFEEFHNLLIALSYNASDVDIDYDRKRIYMNVLSEDVKGEYLVKYDDLIPYQMSTNLFYDDLNDFLKSCIKKQKNILLYYLVLKAKFFKSHFNRDKRMVV